MKLLLFAVTLLSKLSEILALISAAWLFIAFRWNGAITVLIGLGLLFVATLVLALLMLPHRFLVSKNYLIVSKESGPSGLIASNIYIWCVMAIWCYIAPIAILFITLYFRGGWRYQTDINMLAIIIWHYAVATIPIEHMSLGNLKAGNIYSGVMTFFIRIAYVSTLITSIFFDLWFTYLSLFIINFTFWGLINILLNLRILHKEEGTT